MHNRTRDPIKKVAVHAREVLALDQVAQRFSSPAEKFTEVLALARGAYPMCR
jgi:hypothetical protein